MEVTRINLIYLAAGYARRFGANKLLWELDKKPLFVHGLEAMLELKVLLEQPWRERGSGDSPDGRKCGDSPDTGKCGEKRQLITTITVVTAYDEITDWCAEHGVFCIRNNPPRNTGMASSIQRVLSFLEKDDVHSFDMYFTADQPNLDAKVLFDFVQSFLNQRCSIGAMECGGILRNPGIFADMWRADFGKLTGDEGGKQIRQKHPEAIYRYAVMEDGMFADIDTQKDIH